jgi:hypothetical protein
MEVGETDEGRGGEGNEGCNEGGKSIDAGLLAMLLHYLQVSHWKPCNRISNFVAFYT